MLDIDVKQLKFELKQELLDELSDQNSQDNQDNDENPSKDIYNKVGFFVSSTLKNAEPQTAGNYSFVYNCYLPIEVLAATAKWGTAATGGGGGTLQLVNVPNGTAISGGSNIFRTGIDLTATANTWVSRIGKADLQNVTLNRKDALAIQSSGTITAIKDLTITVYYMIQNTGRYRVI